MYKTSKELLLEEYDSQPSKQINMKKIEKIKQKQQKIDEKNFLNDIKQNCDEQIDYTLEYIYYCNDKITPSNVSDFVLINCEWIENHIFNSVIEFEELEKRDKKTIFDYIKIEIKKQNKKMFNDRYYLYNLIESEKQKDDKISELLSNSIIKLFLSFAMLIPLYIIISLLYIAMNNMQAIKPTFYISITIAYSLFAIQFYSRYKIANEHSKSIEDVKKLYYKKPFELNDYELNIFCKKLINE